MMMVMPAVMVVMVAVITIIGLRAARLFQSLFKLLIYHPHQFNRFMDVIRQ